MITLLDVVLTVLTGGLWLFVVVIRNLNSGHKRNKAERDYYRRRKFK